MNIVLLLSNFGPYHLARFKAFEDLISKDGWSCSGLEIFRSNPIYPWKTSLDNSELSIQSLLSSDESKHINWAIALMRLVKYLECSKPDCIAIAGYGNPLMIVALLWAKVRGCRTVLMSDSKHNDSKRFFIFENLIKRPIICSYGSALVGGLLHIDYLAGLGMSRSRIYTGYDVVDNHIYHPTNIQNKPRIISNPYFLTVSRFVPKKNLLSLISAYKDYVHLNGATAWDMIICGDGPMRHEIEDLITRLGLNHKIRLPGFLQENEILPYFAHAKCLVHASIVEQWGLVVNEAMAAGLPVVVSNRCGCFNDLVVDGVNGYGFDPTNKAQLTNIMTAISSDENNLRRMGDASLARIQNYDLNYFAEGLRKACRKSLDQS